MKNFFKKLFRPKNDGLELSREFEKTKSKVMQKNADEIIKGKLIPYVVSMTYFTAGVLITPDMAYPKALQMFLSGKREGTIDELNNIIREEISYE